MAWTSSRMSEVEIVFTPGTRFLINTVLDDAASPVTVPQNWNPSGK